MVTGGKYVLKENLAKSDSGRKLLKISPKDVNIWKPADQADIGPRKKATYKKSEINTFCKEVMVFYATTVSHFMENSSIEKSFCSICSMF